jgi:hypothetical protein
LAQFHQQLEEWDGFVTSALVQSWPKQEDPVVADAVASAVGAKSL